MAKVTVGYANGKTENPTYTEVCSGRTGHTEAVHVRYDPARVTLASLVRHFFRVIDPTALNRQGNDQGVQYRSGIYYRDREDLPVIQSVIAEVRQKNRKPVVTEVLPLANFYLAEEYHQDYLEKNPGGYCHIDFRSLAEDQKGINLEAPPKPDSATHEQPGPGGYQKPPPETLKKKLTPLQYNVTQRNETEPPFDNPYWKKDEPGLYVDVATGEPLFSSKDKFDSGCGWPSFAKPIDPESVTYQSDHRLGMERVETRSRAGNSHLGHRFEDGPLESGGLRYCINSAALRFIPLAEMEKEGYGAFIPLVK